MVAQAAGDALTLAGPHGVLRPAPAPETAAAVAESVGGHYDDYRRSMKARDYSTETLRHHLVSRNWMVGFEEWSGAVRDPVTYNLEQHDRLLIYLREERKLAPNTVYTAIKDLKSFLRWLRDDRGVPVPRTAQAGDQAVRRAQAVPVGGGPGAVGGGAATG